MIAAVGEIVLSGTLAGEPFTLTLTTDPATYRPPRAAAAKRGHVIPGIQSTVTLQDVAGSVSDQPITLEGSEGQGLSQEAVDTLDAMAAVPAATYTFTDWLGHTVTVWIEAWERDLAAPWQLYAYTLALRIVEP